MSQDRNTVRPAGAAGRPSEGDDAELLAALEADEALAALGASLQPVEPSAGLRAAVLDAIAADAENSEAAAAGEAADVPAAKVTALPQVADRHESSGATTSSASEGQVVELRPRRRWLAGALRVAASVAVLAVGIGIGRWSAMDSMAPTEHFAHLNQAQDVKRVTDTMPDGHIATLTWSEDMSMTALSLPDQMMVDAAGASLQVWLRKGGEVRSLGLYDPAKGAGFTFLDLMPEAQEQVFITLEPKGGSAQPTGEPLVTFDVNADGTTTRKPTAQPTATSQA